VRKGKAGGAGVDRRNLAGWPLTEDLGAGGRVLSAHSCNGRQQPENEGLRMSPCPLESGDSFDLPFPLFYWEEEDGTTLLMVLKKTKQP